MSRSRAPFSRSLLIYVGYLTWGAGYRHRLERLHEKEVTPNCLSDGGGSADFLWLMRLWRRLGQREERKRKRCFLALNADRIHRRRSIPSHDILATTLSAAPFYAVWLIKLKERRERGSRTGQNRPCQRKIRVRKAMSIVRRLLSFSPSLQQETWCGSAEKWSLPVAHLPPTRLDSASFIIRPLSLSLSLSLSLLLTLTQAPFFIVRLFWRQHNPYTLCQHAALVIKHGTLQYSMFVYVLCLCGKMEQVVTVFSIYKWYFSKSTIIILIPYLTSSSFFFHDLSN